MPVTMDSGAIIYRSPAERIALLSLILLLTLFFRLILGSYDTDLGVVLATLAIQDISPALSRIIWDFRMPRAIVAALVGAMMALSGGASAAGPQLFLEARPGFRRCVGHSRCRAGSQLQTAGQ